MAKRNKEYYAEYCLKRRTLGLCKNCSNKICERSTVYCEKCLTSLREGNRKRQHRYKTKYQGIEKYQSCASFRYSHLKSRCKEKEITLLLTKEEFVNWFESCPKICHYCGISQDLLNGSKQSKKSLAIDRKDSDLGYKIDNICLACHRCNNCKSNFFTEREWKEIVEHYIKSRLQNWCNY